MLLHQMIAFCTNDNADNDIDVYNTDKLHATGDGFAYISQSNDATINQNMDLLNSCDESGAGINDALCDND